MYAREYPARLAIPAMLTQDTRPENLPESVSQQGMTELLGHTVNWGKFDPSQPGRQMMEALFATVRANGGVLHGEMPNLKPLTSEYLAPQYKELLGITTNEGRRNWLESVASTFVPGVGPFYVKPKKGGSLAEQVARQLSLIQEASASTHDDVNEWMAPADKLAADLQKEGQPVPAIVQQAQSLRAPYADWKQYEATVKYGHRDTGRSDKLSGEERVAGLLAVALRYYPSLYEETNKAVQSGGWDDPAEFLGSGKASSEWLDAVDRYLYDEMFGAMSDMKREAKAAGRDVG
jgi:hypothetical protein